VVQPGAGVGEVTVEEIRMKIRKDKEMGKKLVGNIVHKDPETGEREFCRGCGKEMLFQQYTLGDFETRTGKKILYVHAWCPNYKPPTWNPATWFTDIDHADDWRDPDSSSLD